MIKTIRTRSHNSGFSVELYSSIQFIGWISVPMQTMISLKSVKFCMVVIGLGNTNSLLSQMTFMENSCSPFDKRYSVSNEGPTGILKNQWAPGMYMNNHMCCQV